MAYEDLTREQLIEALAAAHARVEAMRIDPTYGVLTRVALDAEPPQHGAIIFWDIDHMHHLNEQWGYQDVDRRIRLVCQSIREREDCILVARWYSGDELIYCCPSADAELASLRIVELFRAQGIGITAGVAEIGPDGWQAAVSAASSLVQAAKKAGDRGRVHFIPKAPKV
jgi:GGDEF domain-containing protein